LGVGLGEGDGEEAADVQPTATTPSRTMDVKTARIIGLDLLERGGRTLLGSA
jgi:hypothetical protein